MLALIESSIQLVPDGTLLFHLFLVIVMVVVLNATLLKPINRVLEERDKRTSGKLSEARKILESAEEKLELWEKELREARNQGYRLLERQRAEALSEREARLTALKAELTELIKTQKAEILRQEKEAEAALESDARRLAELIGSKVLGRPLRG
jgi:F-type H+-transporting ATPase subunit b